MTCSLKRILLPLLILLLSNGTPVYADTLVVPGVDSQPPNSDQGVVRPVRGLSMDDVKNQFGNPRQIDGPIGKPPITRWAYDKFTVVFEGNIVIDSFVAK